MCEHNTESPAPVVFTQNNPILQNRFYTRETGGGLDAFTIHPMIIQLGTIYDYYSNTSGVLVWDTIYAHIESNFLYYYTHTHTLPNKGQYVPLYINRPIYVRNSFTTF